MYLILCNLQPLRIRRTCIFLFHPFSINYTDNLLVTGKLMSHIHRIVLLLHDFTSISLVSFFHLRIKLIHTMHNAEC